MWSKSDRDALEVLQRPDAVRPIIEAGAAGSSGAGRWGGRLAGGLVYGVLCPLALLVALLDAFDRDELMLACQLLLLRLGLL